MDPALLREREAFKKKALATPSIEKKKRDDSEFKDDSKKKSKSSSSVSSGPKLDASNYSDEGSTPTVKQLLEHIDYEIIIEILIPLE